MDSADNAFYMILVTLALLLAASVIIWILHRAEKHRRHYEAVYRGCRATESISHESTPHINSEHTSAEQSNNPANDTGHTAAAEENLPESTPKQPKN